MTKKATKADVLASKTYRVVLTPLAQAYGKQPDTQAGWDHQSIWVRTFEKTDEAVLDVAMDLMLFERRYRGWPTTGEFGKFVARAREVRRPDDERRMVQQQQGQNFRDRSAWEHSLAQRDADSKARVAAMAARRDRFGAAVEVVLRDKRLSHAEKHAEIFMMAADANREPDEGAGSEAPPAN